MFARCGRPGQGLPNWRCPASGSLARRLADADQPDPATGQPRGLHPGGVVVLDEAGIVYTRKLCALLTHAAISRTTLVLVGDPRQLPEIEAGGLFTQLARDPNTLHLADNRRQHQPWERDALARLRAGNIDPAIEAHEAHGRIHQADDPEALTSALPEQLPSVLDLPTAARLLGIGRTAAYQLVNQDQ